MERVSAVAVLLCLAVGLVAGAAVPASSAKDDLSTSEFFWGGFGLPRFGFGYGGFGYPGYGFGGYSGFGFGGYPGIGRFGYPGYFY